MIANTLTDTTGVSSPSYRTSQSTTELPTRDGRPVCSDCGTDVPVVDVSEAVCPDCATVLEASPTQRDPEPTYDDSGYSRKRTGGRVTHTHVDSGIGTGAPEYLWRRLASDPHRSPEESRVERALKDIHLLCANLEIPRPERESASRLYQVAHGEGLVDGRCVEGFVAACVLAAVRQSTATIPVSELKIRTVSHANRDQFRTARGVLELELGLEIPPMPPEDFLAVASRELDVTPEVVSCARHLLQARSNDDDAVASISPRTLAAVAIAVASEVTGDEEPPTLAELSETFDVGRSTISRRKSTLRPYAETWTER